MEIKYGQNLGDGAFLLHFGTKSPYFPRFSKRVSSSNLDTNPCRAPLAWCPEWSRADRYPGHHGESWPGSAVAPPLSLDQKRRITPSRRAETLLSRRHALALLEQSG